MRVQPRPGNLSPAASQALIMALFQCRAGLESRLDPAPAGLLTSSRTSPKLAIECIVAGGLRRVETSPKLHGDELFGSRLSTAVAGGHQHALLSQAARSDMVKSSRLLQLCSS